MFIVFKCVLIFVFCPVTFNDKFKSLNKRNKMNLWSFMNLFEMWIVTKWGKTMNAARFDHLSRKINSDFKIQNNSYQLF